MDVKFINPFLQGTIEVLKKMSHVEPRPGKVYLKADSLADGDVSGIIGITGDMIGSLAISFSERCICHLINRMLGESFAEANQDVFDGVGEITNMISGVARAHLEKDGLEVYAAIPSVVFGKDHTINHILKSPSIVIPFATEEGNFVVDVCIRKAEKDAGTANAYRVLNQKTPVGPAAAGGASVRKTPAGPDSLQEPAVGSSPGPAAPAVDRKTALKTRLKELTKLREDLIRELSEKPFMDMARRQFYRKRIPLLDVQIKRCRLDIATLEMLSGLSREDLDNPKIVPHYQHYDTGGKKT